MIINANVEIFLVIILIIYDEENFDYSYILYEQSFCGTELKNGLEKSKHFTTY